MSRGRWRAVGRACCRSISWGWSRKNSRDYRQRRRYLLWVSVSWDDSVCNVAAISSDSHCMQVTLLPSVAAEIIIASLDKQHHSVHTLNGCPLILCRCTQRRIRCTGGAGIDLGELGVKGGQVQETTRHTLIISKQQKVQAGDDADRDLEPRAPEAEKDHLSMLGRRRQRPNDIPVSSRVGK